MAKKSETEYQKKKGRVSGHVTHRATKKAKCAIYLTRSTCTVCSKIFRSPKKKLAHIQSGHKSDIGWNEKRVRKGLFLT